MDNPETRYRQHLPQNTEDKQYKKQRYFYHRVKDKLYGTTRLYFRFPSHLSFHSGFSLSIDIPVNVTDCSR